MMDVTIKDLEFVTEKLFSHLRELGIENIELDQDYYWDIPQEQLYDVLEKPSRLGLGQLTDDWEELQKLRASDRDAVAYEFTKLAAILRFLGQKVFR